MTRDRDTFDAFQPRDRGRFGDNESTAIRSNDSVRSNLVDVTVFFIRETDKAIGIGRTTSVGPVVATDGHRIMVAWDSEGKCRKPTTIGLDRNLLNACKPSKHCREPRIHVDAQGYVDVIWGDASAVRSTKSCRVLGDFPDWRKCVPVKKWSMKPASFRGTYLGDFGKIANALAGIEHAAVRVLTDDECSAAIILFPYSNDRAFGVLMPMHVKVGPGGLPLWVKPVMDASKKAKGAPLTAPVLTFRPRALSSEVALLGRVTAAEIIPCGNRATWVIRLTGAAFTSGPASSFDAARRKVEHEVREWFRAAGLDDVALKLVVRVETEHNHRARA